MNGHLFYYRGMGLKELNDLVNIEIDVGQISVEQLEGASISAEELMALDGLVN